MHTTVESTSEAEMVSRELLNEIVTAFDPAELRCVYLISVPQFGRDSGKPQRFSYNAPDSGVSEVELTSVMDRCVQSLSSPHWKEREITVSGTPAIAVEQPISGQFDRPIGRIGFATRTPTVPSEQVEQLACRFALVVRNAKLERFLRLMADLPKPQSSLDDAFIKSVLDECRDAIGSKDIALWRYSEKSGLVEFVTATRPFKVDLKKGRGLAGTCIATSKMIRIDDLLDNEEVLDRCPTGIEHEFLVRSMGWRSAVFIPIGLGRFSSGVFSAYSGRSHGLNDVDISIATAFAEKLEFAYTLHETDRVVKLHDRLLEIAPAFDAAMLAVGKLHDAIDALGNARNALSILETKNEIDLSSLDSYIKSAKDLLGTFRDGVRFSRPESHRSRTWRIRDVLGDLIVRSKTAAFAKGIDLSFSCPESLDAKIDLVKVERALRNLIENSMDALQRVKRPRSIAVIVSIAANELSILVEDNGPGISPKDKPRIKDLFYTTKGDAGFGMGLFLADQCATAHGGELRIDSREGRGSFTRMELIIPQ